MIGLAALGYLAIALYWAWIPALGQFPPVGAVESGSFGPDAGD